MDSKIENLEQDTCNTIATDETSNVKRTMTDEVNTVEFQEVERINISKEVKMDGTRSKDLQQTLACTSKLMSHQQVKNTKAAPVAIRKWIDTKPVVEKEPMHVRSRLVVREFAIGTGPDMYAGTPAMEALKDVLSIPANRKDSQLYTSTCLVLTFMQRRSDLFW